MFCIEAGNDSLLGTVGANEEGSGAVATGRGASIDIRIDVSSVIFCWRAAGAGAGPEAEPEKDLAP